MKKKRDNVGSGEADEKKKQRDNTLEIKTENESSSVAPSDEMSSSVSSTLSPLLREEDDNVSDDPVVSSVIPGGISVVDSPILQRNQDIGNDSIMKNSINNSFSSVDRNILTSETSIISPPKGFQLTTPTPLNTPVNARKSRAASSDEGSPDETDEDEEGDNNATRIFTPSPASNKLASSQYSVVENEHVVKMQFSPEKVLQEETPKDFEETPSSAVEQEQEPLSLEETEDEAAARKRSEAEFEERTKPESTTTHNSKSLSSTSSGSVATTEKVKECSMCHFQKTHLEFSKNQWKKTDDERKCKACIAESQ